jgi:hypothetical protein
VAFARLAFFPGATAEQYARLAAQVGDAGLAPDGRLVFATGQAPGGWQVVQVWTSYEALEAFNATVFFPALAALGAVFPAAPVVVDFQTADLQVASG